MKYSLNQLQLTILILFVTVLPSSRHLQAATLPTGFTESQVVSGLASPTNFAFAPDGRIFVCEQGGALRVIKNGALLPTPFVTVNARSDSERGLLGVAFDPNFTSTPYVYVYYTSRTTGRNRAVRFTANGDVAVPGSEMLLLDIVPFYGGGHNGGAMHFGADGKLYIAVGEHATPSAAPLTNNLVGKILRINKDGSMPSDNPWYGSLTGVYRSIWAKGLRNPFTFAIQPGTNRLYINDVGQNAWEEVNEGVAGSDYGWPATEGPTTNPSYRAPVYSYRSDSPCAVVGATFYNPTFNNFPSEYTGRYFFADLCGGWIRTLDDGNVAANFASGISNPVGLRVSDDGALYYLTYQPGALFRVTYSGSSAPQITLHPQSVTVGVGQSATFTVQASGSTPLGYQWQRNGVNIAGATASSYTLPSTASGDSGAQFRAIVNNSQGSATSNSAVLTVTTNHAPAATIATPAVGALYNGGSTISFSGSGTDQEDGTLLPSALTWRVDFHHDTHVHPALPNTSGIASGSYAVPTTGETSDNVWYRVTLTVRDSAGLTHTVYRDVMPRKTQMTFQTNPAGLQITLDGQPLTTPNTVVGVAGMQRALGVVSPQTMNGSTYQYSSWSDGGAATHNISTPAAATTYTATYAVATSGFTPLRVNAGGPNHTAPNGTIWLSDRGYLSGSAFSTSLTTANTATPVLYATGRMGATVRYRFTVPNGSYAVTLKFSEIVHRAAGRRLMDIALNGATVATNFDIYATGGYCAAVDRTFAITVTGGQIDILLTGRVDVAGLFGIEIVQQ